MTKLAEYERRELRSINGFYVGLLSEDEQELLDKAVKAGEAIRDYGHPGGFFLGLAKVKVL